MSTGLIFNQLEDYPRPIWPSPPLPFLPEEPALMCLICDAEGSEYINKNPETLSKHYRTKHKQSRIPESESLLQITAQAFSPPSQKPRGWFRVEPNASALEIDEENGVLPASPQELLETYMDTWTPASLVRPNISTLKAVMPFLYHSGWAAHMEHLDHGYVRSLVLRPQTEDPLRKLYDEAVKLFSAEQKLIMDIPEPLRIPIMDEGHGKVFKKLSSTSEADYANTWALWFVFIFRLYLNQEEGQSTYTVPMTEAQQTVLRYGMAYVNNERKKPKPAWVLAAMAEVFFLPESANNFDSMVLDQFNDPTARFALLMCLREDGTVYTPRNVSNELVRIKYAIRLGLLIWARDRCKTKGWSMTG
ncbi:hypothetical protein FRC07_006022 [Ceratobasidium sp. 392]|nr:hypothetical protein FRC07_006022 [Ceratobasidium sp. 392]